MPTTINILPDHLANKIAAGEVVQRPESVVKELLENSLDAHTTSLSITIKDGGKTLIQVTDTGVGMTTDDAPLAFLRHATSKISRYEDLENIRTLGFRGEALASIAAVAQVELKTRRAEDQAGTLIRIEGGDVKERSAVGAGVGTMISVKNIFFNTPARRHFLKSANTEFRHIYDVVQRTAVSHPELSIEFISDDEVILSLVPTSLEERIKNLFGERHFATLVPFKDTSNIMNISGFLGKPDFARKSKVDQFLFLNNRFIINRSINHAIYSGYEHLVEKGNFPFFLVFLELDPHRVDVNVHPSKMEVKFSDEQGIYRFVMAAVRRTLGIHDLVPSVEVQTPAQRESFVGLQHTAFPRLYPERKDNSIPEVPIANFPHEKDWTIQPGQEFSFETSTSVDSMFSKNAPLPASQTERTRDASEVHDSSFLWQLHNKYILLQIRNGLMIVDQHVAHERILYEKALIYFQRAVPISQQMLFPQTIVLTPGDFTLAKELITDLGLLGFELKVFGKNTLVLEGVPPDVKAGSESTILQDILDEFKNNQTKIKLNARENIAKSFACKAAVKAGDKLSDEEMRALLEQLFATSMPYVCPHGRPVIIKIALPELDRRFLRT